MRTLSHPGIAVYREVQRAAANVKASPEKSLDPKLSDLGLRIIYLEKINAFLKNALAARWEQLAMTQQKNKMLATQIACCQQALLIMARQLDEQLSKNAQHKEK